MKVARAEEDQVASVSSRPRENIDWLVGRHATQEAFHGDLVVEKVVVAEDIPMARWRELRQSAEQKGVPWQKVPRVWLDKLGRELKQKHQGVAVRISPVASTPVEVMWERALQSSLSPLFLVLDGIQDPHNLGAILRTASAVGVQGVVIPKRRAAGLTHVVRETSKGAVAHVPIARVTNLGQEIAWLKEKGAWVIGADLEAEDTYHDLPRTYASTPLVLLLGGEGTGLRSSLQSCCDQRYRIPMQGPISSLNVSVATALFLYMARYGG